MGSINGKKFLDQLSDYWFFKMYSAPWNVEIHISCLRDAIPEPSLRTTFSPSVNSETEVKCTYLSLCNARSRQLTIKCHHTHAHLDLMKCSAVLHSVDSWMLTLCIDSDHVHNQPRDPWRQPALDGEPSAICLSNYPYLTPWFGASLCKLILAQVVKNVQNCYKRLTVSHTLFF